MRVFLAGATGVIGRRLTPKLIAAGHEVTGMTRSPGKVEMLRAAGAEPVVADAFDAAAVRAALTAAHPDAVIHELTSLPRRINPRTIAKDFVTNDRLRSEGTRILVEAAHAAGATRILAQSIAFAYAPGPAGTLHEEDDQPTWTRPSPSGARPERWPSSSAPSPRPAASRFGTATSTDPGAPSRATAQ